MMKRKVLAVPFGAVAVALSLISVSYACTSFMGQFKVTGNASGSGTVVATGTGSGMNYKSVSSAYAKVIGNPGGALSLSVNADPANAANKLPSGRTYYLRFDPYTSASDGDFPTHTQWKYDCMEGTYGYRMGSGVTVTTSGSGSWSRTISSTTAKTPVNGSGVPYNEAAACISDGSAIYGNQAPVTIV